MRVCERVSCDIHPAMRARRRAGLVPVSGFIEETSIDQTLEISGAETNLQVP